MVGVATLLSQVKRLTFSALTERKRGLFYLIREGPLENLWGGVGEVQKKNIRARENSMKKNSCTPINPKKYSCLGLK